MDTTERGEKVHSVPVPERFLPLVHKVLAEAYAKEGGSMVGTPQEGDPEDDGISYDWTEEEVALAYRESSPTLRVILDHLANHAEEYPGDWITAPDLALVAYPKDGDGAENKLYGVFGGMSTRLHNRYRKHWFIDYARKRNPDGSWGTMIYRITPERAAWVNKASGCE